MVILFTLQSNLPPLIVNFVLFSAVFYHQFQQQQQLINDLQRSLAHAINNNSNNNSLTETETQDSESVSALSKTTEDTSSTKRKSKSGGRNKAAAAPRQSVIAAVASPQEPTLTTAQKFGLSHHSVTSAFHLLFKCCEEDINYIRCIYCDWRHKYTPNNGSHPCKRHLNGGKDTKRDPKLPPLNCRFGKPGYIRFGDSLQNTASEADREILVKQADEEWCKARAAEDQLRANKTTTPAANGTAGKKQTTIFTAGGKDGQWVVQKSEVTVNGVRMRIAKLILMSNQPFAFAEEKYFRDLIWYLHPNMPLKGRFTAQRDVHHMFSVYKEVIKAVLQDAKNKGTLFGATTDIWSTKCQKRA